MKNDTEMFGKITIQPWGEGSWQAYVPLMQKSLAGTPGVCGSMNADGPWIGGTGKTPEDALAALKLAIGGVMLASCAMVSNGTAKEEG